MFDFDRARRAYAHISHDPERRAEQERDQYNAHLAAVREALAAIATNDEQRRILAEGMERYTARYDALFYAVLDAKGRTASSMITGPSNFPTRRNERALLTERNRITDLEEWSKKARKALASAIIAARSADETQELKRIQVRKWIDADMETVRRIDTGQLPYTRSAFVNSTVGKLRRMHAAGDVATAAYALAYIKQQQAGWSKPFITERNSVWSLGNIPSEPVEQPAGVETIAEENGITAVRDHDANRLQITFPDRPTPEVHQALKSAGWRWTPSLGVWQRQITNAAEWSLRSILTCAGVAADELAA